MLFTDEREVKFVVLESRGDLESDLRKTVYKKLIVLVVPAKSHKLSVFCRG